MCAEPSPVFNFVLGNVSFAIEKRDAEVMPGLDAEIVTIDYEISHTVSGAGICIR